MYGLKRENPVITIALIGSIISAGIYTLFAFNIFYLFDDFQLLIEAKKYLFKSLFLPIGVHLRPIMRAHFLILSHVSLYSYTISNLISLLLFFATVLSFYLIIKEIYNKKTALLSSLFLIILSPYNEAVYWISANGVLYNFLFLNLSLLFYLKNKKVYSIFFLLLSYFSYETWLLIIPIVIFHKISKREKVKNIIFEPLLISSSILILLQFLTNIFFHFSLTSYGTIKSIEELPYRIMVYLLRAISPFYTPSYLIFVIVLIISVLLAVFFIIKSRFDFKISFPLILYFGTSFIFLLSAKIGSRFYFITSAGLSIIIAIILLKIINTKNKVIIPITYFLSFYLIFVSSLSLYIDGVDYLGISKVYKNLIKEGEHNLKNVKEGEKIILEDRVDDKLLINYFLKSVIKKRKLIYYRENSIGGFIYLNDYVDFLLIKKDLVSKKTDCKNIDKIIVIGKKQNTFRKYCFIVKKL